MSLRSHGCTIVVPSSIAVAGPVASEARFTTPSAGTPETFAVKGGTEFAGKPAGTPDVRSHA